MTSHETPIDGILPLQPEASDKASSAAAPLADDPDRLLADTHAQALALLERNLTPRGILAATPGPAAEARAYTRIFGRDGALCAIAMCGCDSPALQQGAVDTLDALVAQQAPNGQIPKYVGAADEDADFWYLGCIDATLWWLIGVDFLRRERPELALPPHWDAAIARALNWLACQEHQRFFLLQQNEASDWADIMPRSGFVLYTNALWYYVKCRFDLARRDETLYHFNHLFHPFSRDLADYRRARLLKHYVKAGGPQRDLYLSFVNFSFFGDEGDVFGNLLAILLGLASDAMSHGIVSALERENVAEPYPVRVVCRPIARDAPLWRAYMGRHQQNLDYQYHNGGIWPFVGGFWVMTLAALGQRQRARAALLRLAQVNRLDDWRFTEWFHGQSLTPMGMAGQSWNAATFLLAERALTRRVF